MDEVEESIGISLQITGSNAEQWLAALADIRKSKQPVFRQLDLAGHTRQAGDEALELVRGWTGRQVGGGSLHWGDQDDGAMFNWGGYPRGDERIFSGNIAALQAEKITTPKLQPATLVIVSDKNLYTAGGLQEYLRGLRKSTIGVDYGGH